MITIATHGGTGVGVSSIAPTYPATAAGRVLLLTVAGKYPTNYPTLPSGWTLINVVPVTANTAAGADNGDCYIWAAYKISDGTETGTLTVNIPSGNAAVGAISVITLDTGKVPVIASASGTLGTEGTSINITLGTDPGVTRGDLLLVLMAGNTDAGAFAAVAPGYTAPGATLSVATTEVWDVLTTQGDDCKMALYAKDCTDGTSNGTPGDLTFTVGGVATAVAALAIRVRQADPSVPVDSTDPTIENFDPAPGEDVRADTVLQFDVLDETGLGLVIIHAHLVVDGKQVVEVVYDNDGFRGNYTTSDNTRTVITGGYRFTVLREGGWPSSPNLRFPTCDTSANIAVIP